MIRTEIIKQISSGEDAYREGEKVKIRMKEEYVQGCSSRKKEYIGLLTQIDKEGCCLYYGNTHMPLYVKDMESIERINEVDEFCKELETRLWSTSNELDTQTVLSIIKKLQDSMKNRSKLH